jgi:hypothetical protein
LAKPSLTQPANVLAKPPKTKKALMLRTAAPTAKNFKKLFFLTKHAFRLLTTSSHEIRCWILQEET